MTACDPLTREECCDDSPCEGCQQRQEVPACNCSPFDITGMDYYEAEAVRAYCRMIGVPEPTAPPLSPTEQATVDRFEAAPDPWEER